MMLDLDRFWEGTRSYLEKVARKHGPLVVTITKSYGEDSDHAEDLFQRVWIHVFENRTSYQGLGTFEAWLQRVAVNVCRKDARERASRRRRLERVADTGTGEEMMWRPPGVMDEVILAEKRAFLREALDELPARQRQALELRFIQDKTGPEAAEVMGVTAPTVRSLVRNGMSRLRLLNKEIQHEVP